MKPLIIIILAAMATGCTVTKIPGVLDAKNFGFNQQFESFNAAQSQTSTNGVTTNTVVNVGGFISEANSNLKTVMDGIAGIAAAFASSGATALFQQQPFLMVPAPSAAGGPMQTLGSPQGPQLIYLLPTGRMPASPIIVPQHFQQPVPPTPPTPPNAPQQPQ